MSAQENVHLICAALVSAGVTLLLAIPLVPMLQPDYSFQISQLQKQNADLHRDQVTLEMQLHLVSADISHTAIIGAR